MKDFQLLDIDYVCAFIIACSCIFFGLLAYDSLGLPVLGCISTALAVGCILVCVYVHFRDLVLEED